MSLSVSIKAKYDGVVLLPWSFAMISTQPLTHTPTQEYVVPRSIPKESRSNEEEFGEDTKNYDLEQKKKTRKRYYQKIKKKEINSQVENWM